MCQAKSAGGKRCAIHQPAFLGMKLMLKEKYGLTEQQVNHAYKNLRLRDKKSKENATSEEYEAFVSAQDHLVREMPSRIRKRVENYFGKSAIISRSLLHATSRLEKAAQAQRTYIDNEIRSMAKNFNLPEEKILEEYQAALKKDAPEGRAYDDIIDTRTRYALIRAGIKSTSDKEPSRRVVLFPAPNSNVVKRMGWSSEDGRVEMELENGIHAFRNVDQEQWEAIQQNPEQFLNEDSRLAHHQYDSPEQAAQDAYRVWCDNCKTYRLLSRNHKCEDDISRAYRQIRTSIKGSEDDTYQPLPTWAYVWEKRPQLNLEEVPDPHKLRELASKDDIVNFEFTVPHEDGEVKASMSAGRIAPDHPTLIMNSNPYCTCPAAQESPPQWCPHKGEMLQSLNEYHQKFDAEDAEDNPTWKFPNNAGVVFRTSAGGLSTQQLRDALSVARRDRPVRLYVESESEVVAGSVDFQKDEDSSLSFDSALFCDSCYSTTCSHVLGVRNRIVAQVEEGFYSPQARLKVLSNALAPGAPHDLAGRERAAKPYSQDVQQYLKDYHALQARADAGESIIPFKEDSVTRGMLATSAQEGQGFGVELEFSFPDGNPSDERLNAIAAELSERGLSKASEHYEYGEGTRNIGYRNGWMVERDESVGGEVISPVLYDNPEDWKNLKEVCDVIKKHGGVASSNAGSHIHIGSPLNLDRDARVMDFIMEHQDSLHRMNKNPASPSHRANGYSLPFTNLSAQRALYAVSEGTVDFSDRSKFACVGAKGGQTTEFRDPDGTLEPGVIQTQVMMYAALVKRAERGELKSRGERHPVGYNYRRRNLLAGTRQKLTDEEITVSDIAFRHTVDELFDDPEDRQRLVALGVLNDWQPM